MSKWMVKFVLIKIVTSEHVLITTLEENSAPVFEVYDPNNDKVEQKRVNFRGKSL